MIQYVVTCDSHLKCAIENLFCTPCRKDVVKPVKYGSWIIIDLDSASYTLSDLSKFENCNVILWDRKVEDKKVSIVIGNAKFFICGNNAVHALSGNILELLVGEVSLSQVEFLIFCYLLKGFNSVSIARILKKSKKAICYYKFQLKLKLQFRTITELYKCYNWFPHQM
jgi:hypothetical protein